MRNLFIKSTVCILAMSVSLIASGPRVTETLFTPIQNEIVSLETAPLYSNITKNGGMIFEIVQTALNSEKESAVLTTYPIKKMAKYFITQEKTLAALGMNFNFSENEKKNILTFPVAIIHEQYMYYKPAHPKGNSFEDKLSKLQDMIYGATPGEDTSAYEEAGIKVVYSESRFLFEKLKTKKVDFIKQPILSSKVILDTHFLAEKNQFLVMESKPQKSVCMIFFNLQNERAEEVSNKFYKGLLNIIRNGQYQSILEKYQGKTNHTLKDIQELKTLLERYL